MAPSVFGTDPALASFTVVYPSNGYGIRPRNHCAAHSRTRKPVCNLDPAVEKRFRTMSVTARFTRAALLALGLCGSAATPCFAHPSDTDRAIHLVSEATIAGPGTQPTGATPQPGAMVLLSTGLVGLALADYFRRKRNRGEKIRLPGAGSSDPHGTWRPPAPPDQ